MEKRDKKERRKGEKERRNRGKKSKGEGGHEIKGGELCFLESGETKERRRISCACMICYKKWVGKLLGKI